MLKKQKIDVNCDGKSQVVTNSVSHKTVDIDFSTFFEYNFYKNELISKMIVSFKDGIK